MINEDLTQDPGFMCGSVCVCVCNVLRARPAYSAVNSTLLAEVCHKSEHGEHVQLECKRARRRGMAGHVLHF